MSRTDKPYNCGHARGGENDILFGGGSRRCRRCHRDNTRTKTAAGRGALKLVIQLHVEGVLSEGQVATATGLGRVDIRALADAARNPQHTPRHRSDSLGSQGSGADVFSFHTAEQ